MDGFMTAAAKCVEVCCSRPGPQEGELMGYVIMFGEGWNGYRREEGRLVQVAENESYGSALAMVAGEEPRHPQRGRAWEVQR